MIIALTRRTTDTALESKAIVPLHATTVISQTRWGEEGEKKKKRTPSSFPSLAPRSPWSPFPSGPLPRPAAWFYPGDLGLALGAALLFCPTYR